MPPYPLVPILGSSAKLSIVLDESLNPEWCSAADHIHQTFMPSQKWIRVLPSAVILSWLLIQDDCHWNYPQYLRLGHIPFWNHTQQHSTLSIGNCQCDWAWMSLNRNIQLRWGLSVGLQSHWHLYNYNIIHHSTPQPTSQTFCSSDSILEYLKQCPCRWWGSLLLVNPNLLLHWQRHSM